jgi:Ca2+-binding EF-hand superfamily protein
VANDRAASGTTTTQDTVSTERVTSMTGEPAVGASSAETTNISMAAIKANFDAFDKQGKGYITREDAAADPHLTAQFDTLDADHDGKLSVTEYMSARNVAQFRPQQGVDSGVQRD